MADLLGIRLKATIDESSVQGQINRISGKLQPIRLNVDISNKALQSIRQLNTEMSKLNSVAQNVGSGLNNNLNASGIKNSTQQINNMTSAYNKMGEQQKKSIDGMNVAHSQQQKQLQYALQNWKEVNKQVTKYDKNMKPTSTSYQFQDPNNSKNVLNATRDKEGNFSDFQITDKQNQELKKVADERQKIYDRMAKIEQTGYSDRGKMAGFQDKAQTTDSINGLKSLNKEVREYGNTMSNVSKKDDLQKTVRSLKTLEKAGSITPPKKGMLDKLENGIVGANTNKELKEAENQLKRFQSTLSGRDQGFAKIEKLRADDIVPKREVTEARERLKKAQSPEQTQVVNDQIAGLEKKNAALKKQSRETENTRKAQQRLNLEQDKFNNKMSQLEKSVSGRIGSGHRQELDDISKRYANLTTQTPNLQNKLNRLNHEFGVLGEEVKRADKGMARFTGQATAAMARIPIYAAGVAAMYAPLRALQDAFSQMVEIDSQMTVLERVSDGTIQMNEAMEQSVGIAEKLGNTIGEVNEGMINFARQGYEGNELGDMTETATVMSNVSDLGVEDAASSLTAAMKGFNIEAEDSLRIVDSLNEVDNNLSLVLAITQANREYAGNSSKDSFSNINWKQLTISDNELYTETISRDSPKYKDIVLYMESSQRLPIGDSFFELMV